MRYDVIVVGAGPGGAATATFLAERGLRVLVLDRAEFPRPKVCGEYLSPEAARILDRLHALKTIEETAAVPLRSMTITAPDGLRVTGAYPTSGPWRGYRDHALAVPRIVLDRVLADRLRETAADFQERRRVTDLIVEGERVVGVEVAGPSGRTTSVRAPIVIGADGRNSVVARRLGLVSPHRLQRLALMTYIADAGGPRDHGEIFVDPPRYAILNPVAPDVSNLGIVVPLAWAGAARGRVDAFFEEQVRRLPHLSAHLPRFTRVASVRAIGPLAYRVASPRYRGVLLVGDAAGFYDPFTGEGIFTALRSAELAAQAAVAALDGSPAALAAYERARRGAFADKALVTRALQVLIGRRWLANAAARLFLHRPTTLDLMMGVIGDFVPPRALIGRRAIRALFRP